MHSRMNFASDTVFSKSPKFMDLGLSSVGTTDKLGSVFSPTSRIGSSTHGNNWLVRSHSISGATADIVIRTESKHNYNFKNVFKTRKDKVVDQDFGHQNDSMSRPHLELTPMSQPPLDSTPLGTNRNNENNVTNWLDSSRKKKSDPTPLTRQTEFPEQNEKSHVPGDLDPDP